MGIVGSVLSGAVGADAAGDAADAQIEGIETAIEATERATATADAFLAPLAGNNSFGAEGRARTSFLFDPQEQVDFLQSNPLYQLALENANRATLQSGAARGRLSSGDTLQDLSNNVLLQATPLIDRQSQNIASALDFDRAVATTRGNLAIGQGSQVSNLLQNIGNAEAAGEIGQANAIIGGIQGISDSGSAAFGGFL